MNDITKKVFIDSDLRQTPTETGSNFRTQIYPQVAYAKSYHLENATLDFTYYVINSTNNILSFTDTAGRTVTITPGTYSASTLASFLSAAMSASGGGFVYSITYNTTTLKYTITVNTPVTINSTTNTSLARILGLSQTTNLVVPAATPTEFPFVVLLGGPDKIYIISSVLGAGNSAFNSVIRNCIGAIPMDVSFGQVKYWGPFVPLEVNLSGSSVPAIDIQLVDASGNIIDLNGGRFTAVINFRVPS